MTVAELIAKLLQCPSDATVIVAPLIRSTEVTSVDESDGEVVLS